MPRIFARHKVADFDAWKPHYDGDVERRKAAGLTDVAVHREVGDENMVSMVWDAESAEGLKTMMNDPGLEAKMKEAGVVGPLEAWIGESLG